VIILKLESKFRKQKKVGILLKVIPIIFGIIISSTFQASYIGILKTIEKIVVPYSFIENNFNETAPFIRFSFFIQNKHAFPIEKLEVESQVNVLYYANESILPSLILIYEQKFVFFNIFTETYIFRELNGTESNFNIPVLNIFWMNVNLSKKVTFYLDVNIRGFLALSLLSFNTRINNINISQYENPFE